jgi:hypothetical protein
MFGMSAPKSIFMSSTNLDDLRWGSVEMANKALFFSYVEVNARLVFSISNVTSSLLKFGFQSSDPYLCDLCFDIDFHWLRMYYLQVDEYMMGVCFCLLDYPNRMLRCYSRNLCCISPCLYYCALGTSVLGIFQLHWCCPHSNTMLNSATLGIWLSECCVLFCWLIRSSYGDIIWYICAVGLVMSWLKD